MIAKLNYVDEVYLFLIICRSVVVWPDLHNIEQLGSRIPSAERS